MTSKKISTEQVENLYQNKPTNFFSDSIDKLIIAEKDNIESVLSNLYERSKNEGENLKLTQQEYEIFGALSFLVSSLGNEYFSQFYYVKIVSDNICDRFKKYELSQSTISMFLKCCDKTIINQKSITETKNAIIDKFTTEFKISDITSYNKMRNSIKELFKTTICPVNFAHDINNLICTKNHTPQSILKLNNSIINNVSMTGASVKHYHALYTNNLFIELLNDSVKIDSFKNVSLILYNAILSLIEAQEKFKDVDNKNIATIINFDALSDDEKTQFCENAKKEYEESLSKSEVVAATPIEQDKEQEIFDTDKTLFLIKMLEQTNNVAITSIETFINAIEIIFNNNDYAQHVMTYIYDNLKHNRFEIKNDATQFLKSESSVKSLTDHIEIISTKYKDLVETLCKEIDEITLVKIVNYVNAAINDCIFETQDQKQYLISQLNENSIKTYKHLQEMISVMESCKCKNVTSYSLLYDYIQSHDVCVDVFGLTTQIEEVVTKMKFYKPVLMLVKKINEIEETQE